MATSAQIATLAGGDAVVITLGDAPRPDLARAAAASGVRVVAIPTSIYERPSAASTLSLPEDAPPFGGQILLTSGTTGAYKKALLGRAEEAIRVSDINERFATTTHTRAYLPRLGLWTSGGYLRTLAMWVAGATVVIEESGDIAAPLRRAMVTDLVVVPATLAEIVNACGDALKRNDALRIFSVGAAAPWTVIATARKRLTRHIFSVLASTEAGVIAVTPLIYPTDQRRHLILGDREVEIVDETGAPVRDGDMGLVRIRLRPDDVHFYLGDVEASAACFRDGCFYPGDMGALTADGRLELRGRASDVIAIEGDKVATGPIEERLERELGVTGVCILATPDADGNDEIHVVVESATAVGTADAARVARTFAGFSKVEFHIVDKLPRNHMGKLDRVALRRRLGARSGADASGQDAFA
jgi:acyl-coenzyme A synthetase/AMP-(fatty) acid ligase